MRARSCVSWPGFRPRSISSRLIPGPARRMNVHPGSESKPSPRSSTARAMRRPYAHHGDVTSWLPAASFAAKALNFARARGGLKRGQWKPFRSDLGSYAWRAAPGVQRGTECRFERPEPRFEVAPLIEGFAVNRLSHLFRTD